MNAKVVVLAVVLTAAQVDEEEQLVVNSWLSGSTPICLVEHVVHEVDVADLPSRNNSEGRHALLQVREHGRVKHGALIFWGSLLDVLAAKYVQDALVRVDRHITIDAASKTPAKRVSGALVSAHAPSYCSDRSMER